MFVAQTRKKLTQFVNLFEKYAKIMHFKQFSEESFSKVSKIFSKCLFRPKSQKIKAWFVKFFEKYAKIIHFYKFSLENL